MPVPVRCGANAHCLGDSTCVCNEVKSQTSTRQNNFLSRVIMEMLIPVVDSTYAARISVLLGHNAIQPMDSVNVVKVML